MNSTSDSKLKPALIGGAALGAASSIPVVNCLNCFCCALVIGGGVLAAFLYLRQRPPAPEAPYGDGALVGLMAGVVGAVVALLIAIPFQAAFSQMGYQPGTEQLEEVLAEAELPPEVEDLIIRLASGEMAAGSLLIAFGFNLVIFSIFAMIGGLIGVALFHKKTPPQQAMAPGPPAAPPPPPPVMNP